MEEQLKSCDDLLDRVRASAHRLAATGHALAPPHIAPSRAQVQHPEIKAKLTQAQASARPHPHDEIEREERAARLTRADLPSPSELHDALATQALLRRNQDLVDDIQRRQSAAQADQSSVSAQNGLHKCPVLIQELNSNLAQARARRARPRDRARARPLTTARRRPLQVVKLYSVFQQDSAATGSAGARPAAP